MSVSAADKARGNALKGEGNKFFAAKNYTKAIEKYSEAVAADPSNHIFYSNRCAAYAGMGNHEAAAADANMCVRIAPDFVKGYFRLASAYMSLQNYVDAEKTVKAGLRVQADHPDLMRIRGEIEAMEKANRSTLSLPERLKAEGNAFFKDSRFDMAIEKYTKALKAMSAADRENSPLAISCLNNRAACYQQMSNYQNVIQDTSELLDNMDPNNMKALLRRGLAFEGLERYRSALADIRAVLAIDPTVDVANKAQHRIGASVRQLKKAQQNGL